MPSCSWTGLVSKAAVGALLAVLLSPTGCASSSSATVTSTADQQIKFGVSMARRELWSEALFRFQRAADLEPQNAQVYNNLAVASEATGRFDKALEFYKEGLRLDPANRTLRGNYSRFVEFYRGFKPDEGEAEGGAPEGGEPGAVSSEPPVPDAMAPEASAPEALVPEAGAPDGAAGPAAPPRPDSAQMADGSPVSR